MSLIHSTRAKRRIIQLLFGFAFAICLSLLLDHSAQASLGWIELHTEQSDFSSINCVDANTCIAVGVNGTILKTTDGSTWSTQTSGTTNTLEAISCVDANNCFVVGRNGTILKTTDGGTTWSDQSIDTSPYFINIDCADTSHCIATGGSGIIFGTSDGGTTWSAQASGTTAALGEIHCADANNCLIVGNFGTILKTTNGGSTWDSQTSGSTENLSALACRDANNCIVGMVGREFLITSDGGTTWSTTPTHSFNTINSISCPDANTCIGVGFGEIVETNDGGSTWSIYTIDSDPLLTDVSCHDANICFTAGWDGIFKGIPTPEISVSGNNTVIPDGDTTPETADDTDFGKVLISSESISHTFTISNTGSLPLNLSLPITLSNGDYFTTTSAPSATIAVGEVSKFDVVFSPTARGVHTTTVNINNDDLNENPYDFLIQGAVNVAPVAADDSYVAFEGNTLTVTAPGVLDNDSDSENDPLTVTLQSNVMSGTLDLAANGSFVYTPTQDFNGEDGFSYMVSDGLETDMADVSINVLTCPDGTRLYVKHDASGSQSGSDWANAHTSLQDALFYAPCDNINEIWVAEGVYYPDEGTGQTDNAPESTFQLINDVAIYGGFDGSESSRTERDWAANITVLSGDIDGNDRNKDGNGIISRTSDIQGSNAYHVVMGSGVTNTAILDGFTINAGQANGPYPGTRGGGIHNVSGSPTLSHLTISANFASNRGGGLYNYSSSPALSNVSVLNNSSNDNGGGIYNAVSSSPTLNNVTISANSSGTRGGGMLSEGSGQLTLNNVTISDNSADIDGGGIYNGSRAILNNLIVTGNYADYGGGMYNVSSITLTNAIVSANVANRSGGGIHTTNNGNKSNYINVTISANSARYDGGGMTNWYSSHPTLNNVIIWNNRADGSTTSASASINNAIGGTATITHSLIANSGGSASWNSSLGTDGGNNIDVDPLFLMNGDPSASPPTAGDYRLQLASPAIDAGDNDAVSGIDTDLAGNHRRIDVPSVVDTGNGTSPIVDMGAYELQPVLTLNKLVSNANPEPLETVTVTLTIENSGLISATNALISDPLPAGLNFVGPITLSPASAGSVGDESSLPTIASGVTISNGASITLTFPVSVSSGLSPGTQIITNTATVTSTEIITPVMGSVMLTITTSTPPPPPPAQTPLSVTIEDTEVIEGDSGTVTAHFTVTLSREDDEAVEINWGQASGTAQSIADYEGNHNGIMRFEPGQTQHVLTVQVLGDQVDEENETFFMNLSHADQHMDVIIADNQGQATIIDDDDASVSMTVSSHSFTEGESASCEISLTSQPTATVTIDMTPDSQSTVSAARSRHAMTFTPENWNTPQRVTITAIDDSMIEGQHTTTISNTVTSEDAKYNGYTVENIVMTITDNDAQLPDQDADGISDDIEAGVPNGDGNNDGTPDNEQANVASLPNSTNGDYVTLALEGDFELLELVDVKATENPAASLPDGVDFPQGFFEFNIAGLQPGEPVELSVFWHSEDENNWPNSYWKYGPTPDNSTDHWYNFDDDGTTGVIEIDENFMILVFVDGERGDADLTANGQIHDPGALAIYQAPTALTLSAIDSPEPAEGYAGALLALLIVGGLLVAIRRKDK